MKSSAQGWLGALLLALLLWSASSGSMAQSLHGKVIKVLDGDTLEILTEEHDRVRVRLAWIDAPEKGQPFGSRAREQLAALCAGVDSEVNPTTIDSYGRTVAEVHCLGIEANQAMISSGLAWVYRQYAPDTRPQHRHLYELEAKARAERAGLWSDPQPTPPWAWRRAHRDKR